MSHTNPNLNSNTYPQPHTYSIAPNHPNSVANTKGTDSKKA